MVNMAFVANDEIHTAFVEGQEARAEKCPKNSNPYPIHTSLWQAWNNGWNLKDRREHPEETHVAIG